MKKTRESKTPIRYGIMPAALVELGWILLIVAALAGAGIFRLILWLLR
jgi:formate hydrogenlyase subunit 3/multisubunit Na+/H+ antiporter MnhD subunit